MKQILVLLAVLVASCASVPLPVTDKDFEARAQAAIGTLVAPAPLELTIMPDYVFERVTLVRGKTIKQLPNSPVLVVNNDDQPLGISLGNGLFLDNLLNLSFRVDLLAGVSPGFLGTTDFWRERPGSAFRIHADYSDEFISVDDRTSMVNGTYRVDTKSNGQSFRGTWLGHKGDSYQIQSMTPSTLAKTDTGVQRTWTEGLEFSLAGPRTMDFSLRPGRVFERSSNKLLVETSDLYVRVQYAFDEKTTYRYRLYRSASGTAVISEDTGALIVFRKTDTGLDWQSVGSGPVPAFQPQGRLTVRPAS